MMVDVMSNEHGRWILGLGHSLRCERIVVDIECTVYEKVANQKQCRFGGSQH